jgi:hypothetical protein
MWCKIRNTGRGILGGEEERRKHPRKEVNWPISIVAEHGTIEGEIRNVTIEGLLVFCDEPLRLNERYRMSIVPGESGAIGVSGQVVRAEAYCMAEDDTAFGIGICIVEISDQDRETLREILSGL